MGTSKRRWRIPSLLWLPLIVCCALLLMVDIFHSPYTMIPARIQADNFSTYQRSLRGFLVKTPGCRIPYMHPFDSAVLKFVFKEKRPVCNNGIPALVDSNFTSIFIDNSAVKHYTNEDVTLINCCYQPFHRVEPHSEESDSQVKFSNTCIPFNGSIDISDEFIRVTCSLDHNVIYKDFFSFVPIKIKKRKVFKKKPLNILIVGIDSVSRLNFHRQMPTTVEYLKNISAVELLGYNKIADNTYPNLIAVLTGLNENEVDNLYLNTNDQRFDQCPLIWNEYKSKGYVTSFGEDSSWIGLFTYMKQGFIKQPTDYMWGVFSKISETEIGNAHKLNVKQCVGARETYKVFLNYTTNFVTQMSLENLPYFALFWSASLSHDYLNKPNLGDIDYYNFLKYNKENGFLDHTVVIMMSDHGMRFGDIRQTYQGRMEERLPFIFMVLPEWYKRQYKNVYNYLLKNTRRLTTPFDMYKTLKDLLNPYNISQKPPVKSRGYSLFNEIPQNRTCEDAEVSSHWCTCQQSFEINRNDSVVVEAAKFAVDYINQQLEGYAQCSNLTLYNISDARIMSHRDHILNGNKVRDYMIVLQTIPGKGLFEATLRNADDKKQKFEVMGTISRLNLYGKQSACITDFHLKLYCYCKGILM